MTKKHRDRFLLAFAVAVVVSAALTSSAEVSGGAMAALGVAAITAVPALLLLGVAAYIVHGEDRERELFTGRPPSGR